MRDMLRSIPAMDKSMQALLDAAPELANAPRKLLKESVSAFWNKIREEIRQGKCEQVIDLNTQLPALLRHARKTLQLNLRPALNGAGVVIHTNLGRSILSRQACEAALMAASNYCTLEMDVNTGARGGRHNLTSRLIQMLTGAEDALVVNNNAAAVLLILDTLCKGGETIVSRGELVEIGGSFRIPDIMRKSGAILKEVGTTNRTHLADYENAITENTRAIMRVHASNFRIIGFHAEAHLKDLKNLAHAHNLPLIVDLGSGNLLAFDGNGLPHEPTVQEVIAQGADIVCFSGDKALGGPQAGIIAGKKSIVEKLKKNPLTRALRCDKMCLAALEATLRLYLDPETAIREIPTPAMLAMPPDEIARNARALAKKLRQALANAQIPCQITLLQNASRAGGGSFPEYELATTLVCVQPQHMSSQQLRMKLLQADIPLIGRMEQDAFCLDPRTLQKKDYRLVIETLVNALVST